MQCFLLRMRTTHNGEHGTYTKRFHINGVRVTTEPHDNGDRLFFRVRQLLLRCSVTKGNQPLWPVRFTLRITRARPGNLGPRLRISSTLQHMALNSRCAVQHDCFHESRACKKKSPCKFVSVKRRSACMSSRPQKKILKEENGS